MKISRFHRTLCCLVHNQNFHGGGGQGDGWGGGNSERDLKWGNGMGIIKESFQKHLEIGGGKMQKLFVGERGYRRCHHPCLPPP